MAATRPLEVTLDPNMAYPKGELEKQKTRLALMKYVESAFGIPRSMAHRQGDYPTDGIFTGDYKTPEALVTLIWDKLYVEKGWREPESSRLSPSAPQIKKARKNKAEDNANETENTTEVETEEVEAPTTVRIPIMDSTEESTSSPAAVDNNSPVEPPDEDEVDDAAEVTGNGVGHIVLPNISELLVEAVSEIRTEIRQIQSRLDLLATEFVASMQGTQTNVSNIDNAIQDLTEQSDILQTGLEGISELVIATLTGVNGTDPAEDEETKDLVAHLRAKLRGRKKGTPSTATATEGADQPESNNKAETASVDSNKQYTVSLTDGQEPKQVTFKASELFNETKYPQALINRIGTAIGVDVKSLDRIVAVTTIEDQLTTQNQ